MKSLIALILIALLAAAGWLLWSYDTPQPPRPQVAEMDLSWARTHSLPDFSLPDLEGTPRNLNEWRGKLLVVNFWATWCPPCREEMPLFVETQKQHAGTDLQFLGIAIDDPDMVRDFRDVYAINFPILTGGPKAIELSNSLGNRFDGLPFTAVFDRAGNLRYIQSGQVSPQDLQEKILALL